MLAYIYTFLKVQKKIFTQCNFSHVKSYNITAKSNFLVQIFQFPKKHDPSILLYPLFTVEGKYQFPIYSKSSTCSFHSRTSFVSWNFHKLDLPTKLLERRGVSRSLKVLQTPQCLEWQGIPPLTSSVGDPLMLRVSGDSKSGQSKGIARAEVTQRLLSNLGMQNLALHLYV